MPFSKICWLITKSVYVGITGILSIPVRTLDEPIGYPYKPWGIANITELVHGDDLAAMHVFCTQYHAVHSKDNSIPGSKDIYAGPKWGILERLSYYSLDLKVSVYAEVYKLVKRIPRGRVLTYGLISDLLNKRLSAQGVGWALKALPERKKKIRSGGGKSNKTAFNSENVPWHRVINSSGGLSTHKNPAIPPDLQKILLQAEGITFDSEDKIDLSTYLWLEGVRRLAAMRKRSP
jgi:methylated-DNA-protein-cysteine methyltransferase-like protein